MAPFGFFRIKIPFSTADLSKPLPISSGAMINDGQPYPDFTGTTWFSISGDNSSFKLVALFDRNMFRLPNLRSTPYEGGGWEGYFLVQRVNDINNNFGLSCWSDEVSVGGNSQACVVQAPEPPPVTGHRLVVRTDPTKVSADGVLVWKDDIPGARNIVTIVTGTQPSISVNGDLQWAG